MLRCTARSAIALECLAEAVSRGTSEALPHPEMYVQHQRKSRCVVLRLAPGRSGGVAVWPWTRAAGWDRVALAGRLQKDLGEGDLRQLGIVEKSWTAA